LIFEEISLIEGTDSNLTGYLVTKITDEGRGADMKKLSAKKFKTFAFSEAGIGQLKTETEGIGVGLSTADSLSDALGGYLTMSSGNFC